jgi:hypothetical protein
MSGDLDFVCERMEPLAALPQEDREFAGCVPLDSLAFYEGRDADSLERSLRALNAAAPDLVSVRYRREGTTPPYVRVAPRLSKQDETVWDEVYAGWVRKLRALVSAGHPFFAQPIVRPGDLSRQHVEAELVAQGDPKLPALLRCSDQVLARAEQRGTADPLWRWVWERGSTCWLLQPQAEPVFLETAHAAVLTDELAEKFWSTVAFVFRPVFELEGVEAACVRWHAAEVVERLGAAIVSAPSGESHRD